MLHIVVADAGSYGGDFDIEFFDATGESARSTFYGFGINGAYDGTCLASRLTDRIQVNAKTDGSIEVLPLSAAKTPETLGTLEGKDD